MIYALHANYKLDRFSACNAKLDIKLQLMDFVNLIVAALIIVKNALIHQLELYAKLANLDIS